MRVVAHELPLRTRQAYYAVREKRFYILTHPAHNPQIVKRAEAIADAAAPPILTPG